MKIKKKKKHPRQKFIVLLRVVPRNTKACWPSGGWVRSNVNAHQGSAWQSKHELTFTANSQPLVFLFAALEKRWTLTVKCFSRLRARHQGVKSKQAQGQKHFCTAVGCLKINNKLFGLIDDSG